MNYSVRYSNSQNYRIRARKYCIVALLSILIPFAYAASLGARERSVTNKLLPLAQIAFEDQLQKSSLQRFPNDLEILKFDQSLLSNSDGKKVLLLDLASDYILKIIKGLYRDSGQNFSFNFKPEEETLLPTVVFQTFLQNKTKSRALAGFERKAKSWVQSELSGFVKEVMGPAAKTSLEPGNRLVKREVEGPHIFICPHGGTCPHGTAQERTSSDLQLACQCDILCRYYRDCCYNTSSNKFYGLQDEQEWTSYGHTHLLYAQRPPAKWLCASLPGTMHENLVPQGVYVINFCPPNSFLEDVKRCELSVPPDKHTTLMDIPVISRTKDIVYQNAYCARCHHDKTYMEQMGTIACSHGLVNKTLLLEMRYLPGMRQWTGNVKNSEIIYSEGDERFSDFVNVKCFLRLTYSDDVGRKCHPDEIRFCLDSRRCPLYRNLVSDGKGNIYKNYECAFCNNVHPEDIKCLSNNYGIVDTTQILQSNVLYDFFNISVSSDDCFQRTHWSSEREVCSSNFECEDNGVRNKSCATQAIKLSLPKFTRSHISFYCLGVTYRTDNITVLSNNDLFVNESGDLYKYGEYELSGDGSVRVCHFTDRWTRTMTLLSRSLISVSLVALFVHMAIFVALPKRRNTPSKNLFSLSFSLFICDLLFVTLFYETRHKGFCIAVSVVFYYFLCAAFLWMNVMSVDICRTFYSKSFKVQPHKLYIQYSIYAWCVPFISAGTAFLINTFASNEFVINPQFALYTCWFNNKWGLITFFTLPAGMIVLINMTLFTASIASIYKQYMAGRLASNSTVKLTPTASPKLKSKPPDLSETEKITDKGSVPKTIKLHCLNGKSKAFKLILKTNSEIALGSKLKEKIEKRMMSRRELKIRLILYCKLAIMMGMTWIFAFISAHTKSYVFEYLFIIFNGLQGSFIFLAFDCKEKTWKDLQERFLGIRERNTTNRSTKKIELSLSNLDQTSYRTVTAAINSTATTTRNDEKELNQEETYGGVESTDL